MIKQKNMFLISAIVMYFTGLIFLFIFGTKISYAAFTIEFVLFAIFYEIFYYQNRCTRLVRIGFIIAITMVIIFFITATGGWL